MIGILWRMFVLLMAIGCTPWILLWWAIDHDSDWRGGP